MIVVAIDGPSGVGKSTVGRRLAARLGASYLDTGAMYRALALKARRGGLTPADADAVAELAASTRIGFAPHPDGPRTLLDGEDVSAAIREPEISSLASAISAIPAVRRSLVREQQRLGAEGNVVAEGRDIGTKVFPDTPFKFFLTAAGRTRAERRWRELEGRGSAPALDDVERDMEKRDHDDSTRADSPLRCDESYCLVDTGGMTVEEVVEFMAQYIEKSTAQDPSQP